MKTNSSTTDAATMHAAVLKAAYAAWMAAAQLRAARARNKRFTFGDQWGDMTTARMGLRQTEGEAIAENGTTPITNNLLHRLVRTIVGNFRTNFLRDNSTSRDARLDEVSRTNELTELDSRALEEFLISGCCLQRIDVNNRLGVDHVSVSNVNVNRFFANAMNDPLSRDCELVGQLHDMSVAELIKRTSGGDRKHAAWIRQLYIDDTDRRRDEFITQIGADSQTGLDFWRAQRGKCRAIEVWTLESEEVLVCHHSKSGEVTFEPVSNYKRFRARRDLRVKWDVVTTWHCRWFSPTGDCLCHNVSHYHHGSHPFVLRFYPLIDGEVHAFVEDMIDQQKFINRLVTMLDNIMVASAKGVLLFPEGALPEGFTWDDARRVWSKCNGILPYNALGGEKPEQVSSSNSNAGAYDMLRLQMQLLEEISGVTGALQGKTPYANNASLYRHEADYAYASLADIFDSFNAFRQARNRKIRAL